MPSNNSEFREDLRWNSYFVDGVYDSIKAEVEMAAQQYEAETGKTVSDDEIESIVEDVVDDGLNALTD